MYVSNDRPQKAIPIEIKRKITVNDGCELIRPLRIIPPTDHVCYKGMTS
jgi:hypothetical protein